MLFLSCKPINRPGTVDRQQKSGLERESIKVYLFKIQWADHIFTVQLEKNKIFIFIKGFIMHVGP